MESKGRLADPAEQEKRCFVVNGCRVGSDSLGFLFLFYGLTISKQLTNAA